RMIAHGVSRGIRSQRNPKAPVGATEAIYGKPAADFCRPCRGLRFVIDAFPRADALGYHLPPLPGLKTQSESVRPNAQLIASIILTLAISHEPGNPAPSETPGCWFQREVLFGRDGKQRDPRQSLQADRFIALRVGRTFAARGEVAPSRLGAILACLGCPGRGVLTR
ncbi:MAG: hypothetical protein ACREJB_05755, partial [Planctomycetaceae bacterium]